MSLVIDAKTGTPVSLDVQNHVTGTLDLAYAQWHAGRQDSQDGQESHLDSAPAAYTERFLKNKLDQAGFNSSRIDSFFLQRELTAVGREVETRYEQPKLMQAIPLDTSVAAGAKYFTASRISEFGEPKVWVDGMEIPAVELTREEEIKQVITLVIGANMSLSDMMSAEFAGKPLESLKIRAMQRAIEIKLNRMIAFGHVSTGTYGLLTHPYILKLTSPIEFDGTETPQVEVNEISRLANFAKENNKDAFESNAAIVSARVMRRWQNTQLTGTSVNMFEFVRQNNPQIARWIPCWEFQGQGPNGEDGVMFTRLEADSLAYVAPQGFTLIPGANEGLSQKMYGLAQFGGVQAYLAANSILAWVRSGN